LFVYVFFFFYSIGRVRMFSKGIINWQSMYYWFSLLYMTYTPPLVWTIGRVCIISSACCTWLTLHLDKLLQLPQLLWVLLWIPQDLNKSPSQLFWVRQVCWSWTGGFWSNTNKTNIHKHNNSNREITTTNKSHLCNFYLSTFFSQFLGLATELSHPFIFTYLLFSTYI
jgi:hypothetical protein